MTAPVNSTDASHSALVAVSSGRRSALVVGVNGSARSTYLSPLKAAEDDARAIGQILQNDRCCRFNVTLLLGDQASAAEIRRAIGQLKRGSTLDDELLFYFSGHALPLKLSTGDNDTFFCTSDFAEEEACDDPSLFFSMSWLYKNLYETCVPGNVLIILDSCFAGNIVGAGSDPLIIDMRKVIEHYKQRSDSIAQAMYNNRLRFILAATGHSQPAAEQEEHGLFTHYVLQLLEGQDPVALGSGLVTPQTLIDYAQQKMPDGQQPSSISINNRRFVVADHSARIAATRQNQEGERRRTEAERQHRQAAERARYLQALVHDHSSFVEDRLASFVGRLHELAEIRSRIAEKLASGGYVTITGQAGQGKSSIIAKIVQEYGLENVAHHFIPFNPGPDHQVGLLRNLMSRLILKYNLSDIYVSSDSRPALRDYFSRVLKEVATQGGHEIIFIDGLDQLEEDVSGTRDLSFLPVEPPEGVVFVLGTRPDDTLKPLELLKPRHEYRLPSLSRADFDLILQHYQVELDSAQAEQFYTAMGKNALYLDLVAKELKELAESKALRPEEVIRQLADNPDNLFSLAMDRLKRNNRQWREVIKPILGVLLAAREPLRLRVIRQIIKQDDDSVRDGLQRLGGLIARDGRDRYYLYHLKLYDYMRQDLQRPDKLYVFADDEEEGWHQRLAEWCAGARGGLAVIWEDAPGNVTEQDRRAYAREHYIAHLYLAKSWQELWQVLDAGMYGRAKLRHDPSTRGYALDLDFGRQAAARLDLTLTEGLALLPTLWRYSLLRCSLASQADNCSLLIFESLVTLGREREAIGLIELMTNTSRKAMTLAMLGNQLARESRGMQEGQQLLTRALEVANTIENDLERPLTFLAIAGLAMLSGWPEQAHAILDDLTPAVERITLGEVRAGILLGIGALATLDQRFECAHNIIDVIRPLIVGVREPAIQVSLLLGVAALEVLSGRVERAGTVLDETRVAIQMLDDKFDRAMALLGVAAVTVLSGQHERASNLLDELCRFVETFSSNRADTLTLFLLIAATYLLNKQPEQAHVVFRDTMQTQILNPEKRGASLRDLLDKFLNAIWFVWKYMFLEDMTGPAAHIWEIPPLAQLRTLLQALVTQCHLPDTVVTTLKALEDTLPSLESPKEADKVRRTLATLYAQGGIVDRAIPIASAIDQLKFRANTFISIARSLTESGAVEQAQELLDCALDTTRQIPEESQRAECMAKIVWELLQRRAMTVSQPILDEATAAARSIVDDQQRPHILQHIANALNRAGRRDDALVVLDQAATVARAIRDVAQRAAALQALAIAFFLSDREPTALTLLGDAATAARAIDAVYIREGHLQQIGAILVAIGKGQEAFALAGDISLDYATDDSVRQEMVVTSIQMDRLANALAIAQEMHYDQPRKTALQQVAQAFVQAGRLDDILDVVTAAPPKDQAAILAQVAVSLASARRFDEALSIVACQVASNPWQEEMLDQIVSILVTGDNLDNMLAIVRAKMGGTELPRMLLRIVVSLAQSGRFHAAQQLVGQVDDALRTCAFRQIALALAHVGRVEEALSMLQQANSVPRATEDNRQDLEILLEIAVILVHDSRHESARDLLIQVMSDAHSLNGYEQTEILLRVAAACIAVNFLDMAGSVLGRVMAYVRTGGTISDKLRLQLAVNLTQAGQQSEGTVLFEEILYGARSRTYTYSSERDSTFGEIAVALVEAGRLDEALTVAMDYRMVHGRDSVHRQIAPVLARTGHLQEALTTIKTVDSYARNSVFQQVISVSLQAGYIDETIVAHRTADDLYQRAGAQVQIAAYLDMIGLSDDAHIHLEAVRSISLELNDYERSDILSKVATVHINAGRLDEALVITRSIDRAGQRSDLLQKIVNIYARANDFEHVLRVIQANWSQALTRDDLLHFAPVAYTLVDRHPDLGLALAQAFTWVDAFLSQ